MALKLSVFFDLILYWTQMISSGNNHFRLDVIDRWRELSPENIRELTKRRPNWKEELDQAFYKVQDAVDPVNEIACIIEEILAEREKAAA